MIELLSFLAGMLVQGGVSGILLVLRRRSRPGPANVDYRERWHHAVGLLGETGQLTDAQVASLRGTAPASAPARPPVPAAAPVPPSGAPAPVRSGSPAIRAAAQADRLRVLHGMATWDRRDLEVERARQGLPPVDDMKGMATWDKRDVLAARARYGTG